MAKLNDNHKAFIVRCYARFMSVSEVVAEFRDHFGMELKPNHASCYNPDTRAAAELSEKWRTLYDEERKRFLADVDHIPIANGAYRLSVLNTMIRNLKSVPKPNVPLIASLLEQAAKEVGGIFTNRRELTGKGGGPLELNVGDMTPMQRAARAQELIDIGLGRRRASDVTKVDA